MSTFLCIAFMVSPLIVLGIVIFFLVLMHHEEVKAQTDSETKKTTPKNSTKIDTEFLEAE